MTVTEKREKITALKDEADAILTKAETEKRGLTPEEIKGFDELHEQAQQLEADLDRREKQQALEKRLAQRATDAPPREDFDGSKGDERGLILPSRLRGRRLRVFQGQNAEERAYRSGMWISGYVFGNQRALAWCAENGLESRAQAGSVNSAGGVLVPEEFSQAIIDLRELYGVFRREGRVIPMGSDTLNVPRRTGGLTAYFVGENAEITDSTKGWDSVTLTARKLAALVRYSSELNEDAVIDIAEDLAQEIGYAFALKEDECGFNGDGSSNYGSIRGVTNKINDGNHAGSIVTAATGNTAFSTLDLADFHSVVGKLPIHARPNAKWYVSAPGYSDSMERLAYAAGGNTVDSISGGKVLSFLGYPVVLSQVLNATLSAQTNAIVLFFGDLRKAALVGDRRGIVLKSSGERYLEFDQWAIQGTERFDVVVHDLGSASAAGPIVALKTPNS